MRLLRLDKISPCSDKELHQLNPGEAKLLSDGSTARVRAEQCHRAVVAGGLPADYMENNLQSSGE
jgi:hypothetical protein